ncbi:perlucin [Diabrotica virgifera virgifera]|uniref:Perlucin-like n=1 Tax=Diabrotica virgifera virgifera TaxID=50390 RepID=A0A6P7F7X8_DIAVI|nr:perlucin [Diabrotica virgifera virgifera]
MTNTISVFLFLFVLIWKGNTVEGNVKNLPSIHLVQNTNPSIPNLITFGNSVYYIVHTFEGYWLDAMLHCKSLNMDLVSIESQQENNFLHQKMREYFGNGPEYWFWSSGAKLKNRWVWMSKGRPINYYNWYPNQPDNARNEENRLELRWNWAGGLRWNDRNGDGGKAIHALCEAEIVKPFAEIVGAACNCNVTDSVPIL